MVETDLHELKQQLLKLGGKNPEQVLRPLAQRGNKQAALKLAKVEELRQKEIKLDRCLRYLQTLASPGIHQVSSMNKDQMAVFERMYKDVNADGNLELKDASVQSVRPTARQQFAKEKALCARARDITSEEKARYLQAKLELLTHDLRVPEVNEPECKSKCDDLDARATQLWSDQKLSDEAYEMFNNMLEALRKKIQDKVEEDNLLARLDALER